MTSSFTSQYIWIGGSIRASREWHARLTRSILSTTLRFLDKTPVGRILQRFTADMRSVDDALPDRTNNLIEVTIALIEKLIVIICFTPAFLVPAVILAAVGNTVAQWYIRAQLPVKRCSSILGSCTCA